MSQRKTSEKNEKPGPRTRSDSRGLIDYSTATMTLDKNGKPIGKAHLSSLEEFKKLRNTSASQKQQQENVRNSYGIYKPPALKEGTLQYNSAPYNQSESNLNKYRPSSGTFQQSMQKLKSPTRDYNKITQETTKSCIENNGNVFGYAANTNKGLIRNYNEDRVAIILNIMKPLHRAKETWPKCSFFGVYDGHGGVNCADFLRDNLHQYVIREPTFPSNPKEALRLGFLKAENRFLEMAQKGPELDRSGSCAIVVLIVGDQCFVANVGDSRAVMSGESGTKVYTLSRDHKPEDEEEKQRILEAGGRIYKSQFNQEHDQQVVYGPLRVFPGRLSVCRTFGDIEAKFVQYGGNGKVVICDPEIRQFKLLDNHDFIVLGCDGIFDKLTSKDAITQAWDSVEKGGNQDVSDACGNIVNGIMNESLRRKTCDNVTVVAIGLAGLASYLQNHENKENKTKGLRIQAEDLIPKMNITRDTPNSQKSSFLKQRFDRPI